ncbi:MAG TPA: membrane dipeptidase [Vicinamibacterales bacterium]|nr:membrane dipeptidase [Vicinamibacterales bacterium]
MKRWSILPAAAVALALSLITTGGAVEQAADDALVAKAREIHRRVIALDTHVDINVANFTATRNYTQDLERVQVTLPKMFAGGLDAAFFIVYVGQNRGPDAFTKEAFDNAYKQAIDKFDAIHRLTKEIAPDRIELALTSADVRRIDAAGKKVALIGVENGYPLGDESTALARVKEFHDRGARYLSLAHNGHSQLADSNTGEADGVWLHNGLSPLGRRVVEELNRVGIMVDISHPSKEANLQAMALSKAPVIASHSGARAVQNHSRNLDDEQLLALKKNGGVAQAVALDSYVKVYPPSPERSAALAQLAAEFDVPVAAISGRGFPGGRGGAARGAAAPPAAGPPPAGGGQRGRGASPLANLSNERRAELEKRVEALNAKFPPPPRANVKDFVDHIDYIVKKIGIDHVGISSDFDGGGGIDGWADASETFNVTLELVRRGYTEEQIAKIWSGNLLRVLDEVQKVARQQR